MKTVMIQCGDAYGFPLPFDGQYLKSFDFEAHDGQGDIDLTPDISEAMKFDDVVCAVKFRNRIPECKPLRPDGLPNRPLTAATWRFQQVPE